MSNLGFGTSPGLDSHIPIPIRLQWIRQFSAQNSEGSFRGACADRGECFGSSSTYCVADAWSRLAGKEGNQLRYPRSCGGHTQPFRRIWMPRWVHLWSRKVDSWLCFGVPEFLGKNMSWRFVFLGLGVGFQLMKESYYLWTNSASAADLLQAQNKDN